MLGPFDGMPNGSRVGVDLVVIPSGEAFVTEKVDGLVLNTGNFLLGLDMPQTIRLVPTSGEDVKRDLPANRVPEKSSMHLLAYEEPGLT